VWATVNLVFNLVRKVERWVHQSTDEGQDVQTLVRSDQITVQNTQERHIQAGQDLLSETCDVVTLSC
jgi:hypothetical protein